MSRLDVADGLPTVGGQVTLVWPLLAVSGPPAFTLRGLGIAAGCRRGWGSLGGRIARLIYLSPVF